MRKFRLARCAYITLLLSLAILPHADAEPGNLDGLDEFVEEAMSIMGIPGLALTVVDSEGVVLVRGYGTRTTGKNETVDGDTVFNIGSMTKAFTATAVGVLTENSDLSWDSLFVDELPYFQAANPYLTSNISIRDGLAHRSGIPGTGYWAPWTNWSRQELVERLEYIEPVATLRNQFFYNNGLFVAAGEVIPQRTGISWDSYVKEKIIQPLGMTRTYTVLRDMPKDNIATPHIKDGDEMRPVPNYPMPHVAPAGSMLSSANDMARWCQLQLSDGSVEGVRVIEEATLREIHSPQMVGGFDFLQLAGYGRQYKLYGLGWFILDYRDELDRLVAHGGSIDGMQSWMAFSPRNQYCVSVLSNGGADGDAVLHAVANFVQDRYLEKSDVDWIESLVKVVHEEISGHRNTLTSRDGADDEIPPTLSKESYTGTYEHPANGPIEVTVENGVFHIRQGIYTGVLEHWRGDTFRTNWDQLSHVTVFGTFLPNPKGQVETFRIRMEGLGSIDYERAGG